MKKIYIAAFMLFSISAVNAENSVLGGDCVDNAISSLEDAENKLGHMMSDIDAAEFLNVSIAMCETFPWYW
ncbi:hypothetical protein SAMN04489761_3271 [Tenacibaculum sp. MAR_2009_124]|uniref:hypothetical protein n=1 Tax=Tenacibaculum sp. MAR_2009_124 TaxID=1250059 RepID=UPI00089A9C8E|nr:hypothetical protein [Tenacibaculum sp. MAR_2009_124]SEC54077.1 hypothetical protein SAMN04489761_3271 [Tenacibaculum sp. MAR_2009_124]